MLGGQEHELTMRTAELIEDNAEQALKLLVAYATSSRKGIPPRFLHICSHTQLLLPGTPSCSTALHHGCAKFPSTPS